LLPERPDSARCGAELFIDSGGVALQKPAATTGRRAAGAEDETSHFASEALPERGAQSGGPVTHPKARSVLPDGGQMKRSAGETSGESPFEHLFPATVPGGDPVP